MVSLIYFLIFAVSLGVLIFLLAWHTRIFTNIVFLSLLVSVNALGRFLISVSMTMELALLGNLFLHIGSCFCPLLVLLILSGYCRDPLPRWAVWLLSGISLTVVLLVCTGGWSPLYYRDMLLCRLHNYSYLSVTYGPAHFLFPALMILYIVLISLLLIRAYPRQKQTFYSTALLFTVFVVAVTVVNLLDTFSVTHISYTSLVYLLGLILLTYRVEQVQMYDLPASIASSIEAMDEIAYIQFDDSYRCMGYNQCAARLFPEIEKICPIGQKPVQCDTVFYNKVLLWMYCRKQGQIGHVRLGDRYYSMEVRPIPYRNQDCVGYLLELVDRTAEAKWLDTVNSYNEQLKTDVRKATAHISYMKDMMVVGMASMVESRDDSTGGHIKRTYQVMRTFAEHLLTYCGELGITTEFLEMVTRAAPMHDLGKIAIADAVLKKRGRFTCDDYAIMKHHPEEGAKIVRHILTGVEEPDFVELAVNVAHYHHERWDGTGYPEGLAGLEIPLEARLMALADVCDALLSKRCYKDALSYDQAFQMIEDNLGTQFDPVFGRYFVDCRPQIEKMYAQWYREDRDGKLLQLEPVTGTSGES